MQKHRIATQPSGQQDLGLNILDLILSKTNTEIIAKKKKKKEPDARKKKEQKLMLPGREEVPRGKGWGIE